MSFQRSSWMLAHLDFFGFSWISDRLFGFGCSWFFRIWIAFVQQYKDVEKSPQVKTYSSNWHFYPTKGIFARRKEYLPVEFHLPAILGIFPDLGNAPCRAITWRRQRQVYRNRTPVYRYRTNALGTKQQPNGNQWLISRHMLGAKPLHDQELFQNSLEKPDEK